MRPAERSPQYPAHRHVKPAKLVHTRWLGKKVKQVEVIDGPYLDVDSVECDCAHWFEILKALGGENLY